MIDNEMLLKPLYFILDRVNLAVATVDRNLLLIALVGFTCLLCLVRLFRIWHRGEDLIRQQESLKSRIVELS